MQRELPPQIYEIRDLILQSVEAEKIYLFGSYAYGTPTEDSDYDFYVVLPDNYPMRRHAAAVKIRLDIIPASEDKPCDILVNYKTQFERTSREPSLIRKIVREGITLYDRSQTN
ncbi:MAG: nucleotidyltransferase domain-containing protein [Planctomycetaceae bacterium]|jgi:predicted nucleotidyltransferase|nr:nucleotidyltransferase domain-containing protein [Planctomycetaceae bacterium]